MKRIVFTFFLMVMPYVSQVLMAQDIQINEIVSANSSGVIDSYGNYSDWIELKNTSDQTIHLQGYYLSDNLENPLKWSFPNVSMLPNTYLIIFASENDNLGEELHANFKLSKEGETLSLYNHLGVLLDRYDSVLMKTDVSYGRPSQRARQLAYFDQPSPGSANNTTA